MDQTKTLVLDKANIITAVKVITLLAVATVTPMFIHEQAITGPLVNATLFLSVMLLGTRPAFFVALIPSTIALSTGLLPAVLAPMVPFIMISNALLILVFSYLKERFWLGVIVASIIKFVFLFSTSSVVINLLLNKTIATKVAAMMSWPQLVTAIGGGILAYLILKPLKVKLS